MADVNLGFALRDGVPHLTVSGEMPFEPKDFIGRPDLVVASNTLDSLKLLLSLTASTQLPPICNAARRHFEEKEK